MTISQQFSIRLEQVQQKWTKTITFDGSTLSSYHFSHCHIEVRKNIFRLLVEIMFIFHICLMFYKPSKLMDYLLGY